MSKPVATALSATASAFAKSFSRAKSLAGRLRPTRRQLVALAPLMATTAMAGDMAYSPPLLSPQKWGHETLVQPDLRLTGGGMAAQAQDNVLPARCYTPQEDEPNPLFNRDETSWRGFYMLANGGMVSRGLHAGARDLDITVCETDNPANIGNYDSSSRIAGITPDTRLSVGVREAAHGIVHAIMEDHDLSTPAADEVLFSRLNRHLTSEAVAMTAEYVVAAEQAERGSDSMQEELHAADAPGFRFFNDAWDAARTAGLRGDAAIARAAAQTISHLVRQPQFIAANSDPVLRDYVTELGARGMEPRRGSDFDRSDARRMGQFGRGASIASDVQLLTPDELAAIAPQTASVVEALQRLHARRNTYTAPRAYVSGNVYARVTLDELQQQMTQSQGVYTATQAFERARTADSAPQYNGRTWQMRESFTFGMQADYSQRQTPAAAASLWQQMDNMRRLSPTFGPHMADMAVQANVVMCYGPLSSTLLGEWQPNAGIIVLNTGQRNLSINTRTLAHELLHMAQHRHGIGMYYGSWTASDIQMSSLTREASASVISVLVAMEFKLYGDDSLWAFGDDQGRADRMLEVYTETRAGGASHQQSLEAAGLEGFRLMFERQWWLNSYNNNNARYIVGQLAANWFRAPTNDRYSLENVRLAGKVTDQFNFTRNVPALPDDRMLFGDNDQMRHLYDYLHLQQLTQSRGASHRSTRDHRASMQAEGNPFINVDFDELAARVAADRNRTVLEHINCLVNGTCSELRVPPASARTPTCGA